MIIGMIPMLLGGAPRRKADGRLLLLATDPRSGVVQLSRFDVATKKARLLWRKRALSPNTSVITAVRLSEGRVALLAYKDQRTTYRTIRLKDGFPQGAPLSVGSDVSGIAKVSGAPVLASHSGLVPVLSFTDRIEDHGSPPLKESFDFSGGLTRGSVAYAFATSGASDLSSGSLFAYTTKGHLTESYRRDFAPGAYALALSGNRLVVPLTDGKVQVYNVADPGHPRLAGELYRSKDWIALTTPPTAERFYGLERSGTLQAYRFDDHRGIVATTNAVPGPPLNSAQLFTYEGGVAVCGENGTVQLYRAHGTTLAKVADLKLSAGQVFVLDQPR